MNQIAVVGSLNMDQVLKVKSMPSKGETVLALGMEKSPGGKGANQAYAVGKLGGRAVMIGAVGTDENGRALKENLESAGVDTKFVRELPGEATGSAVILVDESAENSIVVLQGANAALTKKEIDAAREVLSRSDIVLMQLEIPLSVVQYTARLASEMGKTVILDPAPAVPLPESLLAHVDVLKPNETELAALTGMPADTDDEAEAAARTLIEKGVSIVIVTLGAEGSLLVTREGAKKFPARKVEAVDTTAAGDSFIAAFAVAFSRGKSREEAIECGTRVAALTVTRKGAQTSIPDREEAGL